MLISYVHKSNNRCFVQCININWSIEQSWLRRKRHMGASWNEDLNDRKSTECRATRQFNIFTIDAFRILQCGLINAIIHCLILTNWYWKLRPTTHTNTVRMGTKALHLFLIFSWDKHYETVSIDGDYSFHLIEYHNITTGLRLKVKP